MHAGGWWAGPLPLEGKFCRAQGRRCPRVGLGLGWRVIRSCQPRLPLGVGLFFLTVHPGSLG